MLVVQRMRPDPFFNADQQTRLADLMQRWRDRNAHFPPHEQVELDRLAAAELEASMRRAGELLNELPR